jgi:predicted ATPase
MQSLSPTSRYLSSLKEGSHQPDDVQREAVSRLDTIYHELQNKPSARRKPAAVCGPNSANCWASANPLPKRLPFAASICGAASAEENLVDGSVLSKPAGRT